MKELSTHFDFKARYFKLGEITGTTSQVWYVIHGYGQLAEFFLKRFNFLAEKNICVIAPEGLSRFYLEDLQTRSRGGSNRVGATWMTRENRMMDIENYLSYLDAIQKKETGDIKLPTTILGFSQGAATATRWALEGNIHFERLVLWAGIFPPDMNFEAGRRILRSKKVIAVFGDQDPFVTPERLIEMNTLSGQLGIEPEMIRFNGIHDLDEATLLRLI